jgi:hypothetical protein
MRSWGLSPRELVLDEEVGPPHLAHVVVQRPHPREQGVATDRLDGLLDEVRDDQRVLVTAGCLDEQPLQQRVRRRRELEQAEAGEEPQGDLEERQQPQRQHTGQGAPGEERQERARSGEGRQPATEEDPCDERRATGGPPEDAREHDRGTGPDAADGADGDGRADQRREQGHEGRGRHEERDDDRHPHRPQEAGDLGHQDRDQERHQQDEHEARRDLEQEPLHHQRGQGQRDQRVELHGSEVGAQVLDHVAERHRRQHPEHEGAEDDPDGAPEGGEARGVQTHGLERAQDLGRQQLALLDDDLAGLERAQHRGDGGGRGRARRLGEVRVDERRRDQAALQNGAHLGAALRRRGRDGGRDHTVHRGRRHPLRRRVRGGDDVERRARQPGAGEAPQHQRLERGVDARQVGHLGARRLPPRFGRQAVDHLDRDGATNVCGLGCPAAKPRRSWAS